jgi:hypothetical protein
VSPHGTAQLPGRWKTFEITESHHADRLSEYVALTIRYEQLPLKVACLLGYPKPRADA